LHNKQNRKTKTDGHYKDTKAFYQTKHTNTSFPR